MHVTSVKGGSEVGPKDRGKGSGWEGGVVREKDG